MHSRISILLYCFLFSSLALSGQSNITLSSPGIVPAPLDFRANGTFRIGVYNVNLPGFPEDSGIKIKLKLEKIRPQDGIASVYGEGGADFDWEYDAINNELIGTQNAFIGAFYGKIIFVDFIVTEASPGSMELNGFVAAAIDVPDDGNSEDNMGSSMTTTVIYEEGVSGVVFHDKNQNGIQDVDEYGVQGFNIRVNPLSSSAITNRNGLFYFDAVEGESYDMTLELGSDWILTTANSTLTHTYQIDDPSNSTNYFGITPVNTNSAIEVHLGSTPTRCNSDVTYQLRYQNTGTETLQGTIEMVKDPKVEIVSVSGNVSMDGDVFTWPVHDLYPNEATDLFMTFTMPDESNLAEVIRMEYRFVDLSGTVIYEDTYESELVCSIDPNDKIVSPVDDGISTFTSKDETLIYTIRYENTGAAIVPSVLIQDVLDPNLNFNTFEVLNSSDFVRTTYEDGTINFLFNTINLQPNEEGFITYSIQPLEGLANYTEIRNTASIFFGENDAIVTNTTINTLCDTPCISSSSEIISSSNVTIFPNPTEGKINIQSDQTISKIEIQTSTGKLLFSLDDLEVKEYQTRLHVLSGTYIVKLHMENGVVMRKLIID